MACSPVFFFVKTKINRPLVVSNLFPVLIKKINFMKLPNICNNFILTTQKQKLIKLTYFKYYFIAVTSVTRSSGGIGKKIVLLWQKIKIRG